MNRRILPFVTLLTLAFSLLPVPAARAQSLPAELQPGFGYTWESSLPYQWIEINNTGTLVVFEGQFPDDEVAAEPIPIDFSFKYFEEEYNQLYISTNGFLSFDLLINPYTSNQRIPMDNQPNNIIAPLWADLKLFPVDGSAVYYKNINDASGQYLVIEFYNVYSFSRTSSAETLTFEIILYPNGDIDFIYFALNDTNLDTLTIGFEDASGVEGYQSLYNENVQWQDKVIRAVYPGTGKRVNAFPRYLSGFASHGEVVLPFTVHNTGTEPSAYSFSSEYLLGDANWDVVFQDTTGPVMTTPVLDPGEDYPMQVLLTAPDYALAGNYTRYKLILAVQAGGGTFEVVVQAAVAAPFSMTFIDDGDGYVQFVTPTQNLTRKIFNTYTGAYFSLLHMTEMDYLLAGEKSYIYPQVFKNINIYQFLATSSAPIMPVPLQDHSGDPNTVKDSLPVMARTPDGQMGVAFLRQEIMYDPEQEIYNVYFGLLNSRGVLIGNPVNLTGKLAGAPDRYSNISMAVDPVNNHFVLTWEKRVIQNANIEIAIIETDGSVFLEPTPITDSYSSSRQYTLPRLSSLSTGKLAVAYKIQLENDDTRIGYALLTPNGNLIGNLMELTGYDSQNIGSLTTAPLTSGHWLIAWVNDRDEKLLYVILDDAGTLPAPAADLLPFDLRTPSDIASTTDEYGNIIITWNDTDSDYLHYTLINPTGTSLTPPMAFRRGLDPDDPNIFSSSTGSGLSTCPEFLTWYVNLPVIRR